MKFALLNLCWFLGTAAAFRSKARQRQGIRSELATSRSRTGHPLQLQQQEPDGGSNGRRSQKDRDLVFSSITSPCSDDLLQLLQLSDPTTTNTSMQITNCTETEIKWDEDGILTANLVRTVRAPSDLVSTTYKAYYNNGTDTCQGFNGCVVPNGTEGFITYPGQYEYDCSNVYCGPNAARQCDGTYRDNPLLKERIFRGNKTGSKTQTCALIESAAINMSACSSSSTVFGAMTINIMAERRW
jgi:hypothetical protein